MTTREQQLLALTASVLLAIAVQLLLLIRMLMLGLTNAVVLTNMCWVLLPLMLDIPATQEDPGVITLLDTVTYTYTIATRLSNNNSHPLTMSLI